MKGSVLDDIEAQIAEAGAILSELSRITPRDRPKPKRRQPGPRPEGTKTNPDRASVAVAAPRLLALLAALGDREAPCAVDSGAWFPSGTEMPSGDAVRACAGCPALTECREYAEALRPAWGLWGGMLARGAWENAEDLLGNVSLVDLLSIA